MFLFTRVLYKCIANCFLVGDVCKRTQLFNIWVTTLKVKVTAWPWSEIMSGPSLCYFKSDSKTTSQKWSPYWDNISRAIFGSLPLRSRSQHDLEAKLCPAHNFVLWGQILKLLHRNDHHIETTRHMHDFGHYIKGQGHSLTLKQNHVRLITFLFEVGF